MLRHSGMAMRIATAALATMMLPLVGGAPASAAAAAPAGHPPTNWTLLDVGQRICATPDDPRTLYYFVVLDGTWPVQITADYTGMPAGTVVYGPAIVQPGSGDGHNVQAFAAFRLHDAPLGRYVPELSATDSTVTQHVPVALNIQSSC